MKYFKNFFVFIALVCFFCSILQSQDRFNHVNYLFSQGNYKSAINVLKSIIKKKKDDAEAYYLLGKAYMMQDTPADRKRADDAFQQAITIDRNNISYLGAYAELKIERKQYPEAERLLERARKKEPDNPSIFSGLVKLYMSTDKEEYYGEIEEYMYNVEPDDINKLDFFINLGKLFIKKEEIERAEELYTQLQKLYSHNPLIMLGLSDVCHRIDKFTDASKYYLEGIKKCMDTDEIKSRYNNIAFLFTDDERSRFKSTEPFKKGEYIAYWWTKLDPDPVTIENERLIEHFMRVKFAKTFYSSPLIPGYDDRGKIYVKYGPPDRTFTAPAGSNIMDGTGFTSTVTKGNESWVYESIEKDLSFDFVVKGAIYFLDELETAVIRGSAVNLFRERRHLSRNYMHGALGDIQGYSRNRWAAEGTAPLHTFVPESEFIANIGLNVSNAQFKGKEGKTRIEFYIGFYIDERDFLKKESFYLAEYDYEIVVRDSQLNRELNINGKYYMELPDIDFGEHTSTRRQENLELDKDFINVTMKIENERKRRGGAFEDNILVKDFSGEKLMVSDIQFSEFISTDTAGGLFIKKGIDIVPFPYKIILKEKPVYVYYEIYNLRYNEANKTSYLVEYSVEQKGLKGNIVIRTMRGLRDLFAEDQREKVTTSFNRSGDSKDTFEYILLDMRNLEPGKAVLTIRITDLLTGQESAAEKEFEIR